MVTRFNKHIIPHPKQLSSSRTRVRERTKKVENSWESQLFTKVRVIQIDDLLPRFEESSLEGDRFVFHCFTEREVDARKILDFGAMISFTGVVTYKNATEVAAAAKIVPLDRIMVETDSPYLSPEPVRNIRPNEPKHVMYTASHLASLFQLSLDAFERQTDENAIRFFNLPRGV